MEYVFLLIVLIFSVVFHEVSHGVVANYLGDPTAKNAGRLTLNPIPHIDPIGSVILPGILLLMNLALSGRGIIFGWAKPVPINPYNFRDQKYGAAKVALAGPVANLSLALVFGLTLRFFPAIVSIPGLYLMFSYIVLINLLLAVFNLLPIPPLDGSHILFSILPPSLENIKSSLNQSGFFLVLLAIFFFFQWIGLIIAWLFKLIVGSPLP
jgi:Zn-dependent protease